MAGIEGYGGMLFVGGPEVGPGILPLFHEGQEFKHQFFTEAYAAIVG